MARLRTHYDNLKVSRDAPTEVIKSAYRALANKYHPDRHGGNESAMKAMKAINVSYEVLIDPEKRKAHDAWIVENTRNATSGAQQNGHNFHQHYAAPPRNAPPPQPSARPQWNDFDRAPGVSFSLIPALLTALTLLLLVAYSVKKMSGSGKGQSTQAGPAIASSQGGTENVVEVRKAIPVPPEETASASNESSNAEGGQAAPLPQVVLENRARAINGQIYDSDILVVRGSRMEGGVNVPHVSVSVFGQQVAEARKNTYELPDRRQVEAYTVHFPNSSPGFPIFLKRDNRSFNLVCLDAGEIVVILNRAFTLHRDARSSQSASFSTRIPTGVTLASGSSFDGWLSGTASSFVFNWKLEYLNTPPDQYPLIEGNDWFPRGSLQGNPEMFTIYDAIALEIALKVLQEECNK